MIYTITNFLFQLKYKERKKRVKTYKENKAVKIRNKSYEWRRVDESMNTRVQGSARHIAQLLCLCMHIG